MNTINTTRLIGWNGVRFTTPINWETTVQAPHHLICERNLQPLFEIRWQPDCKVEPDYNKECARFGCTLRVDNISEELATLKTSYKLTPYGVKGQKKLAGLFCYCSVCSTLIHIHIGCKKSDFLKDILQCISSLQCHTADEQGGLLSIQDFSLDLPDPKASMQSYKFQAGLSRIHLTSGDNNIHICRLASAEKRLQSQSLQKLLQTLCGIEDLLIEGDGELYYTQRTPSIWQQIVLRMKRKKPFVKAAIRHIKNKDRLLTLLMESKKPIDQQEFDHIWNSYDILP